MRVRALCTFSDSPCTLGDVSQQTTARTVSPACSPSASLPPLRDVLYRQRQRTDEIEKEIGRKVEYVFHRRGNIIKEYYGAWRSACKRVGLSGRLVPDFRRTAVDRLEWSGVPRAVAMKLTGHETDAVYSRYHIARGKDLRAGVARVADYIEALNGFRQRIR